MRFAPFLSLAALVAVAYADEVKEAAEAKESVAAEKPSDVLSLSSSTFESSVQPEPLILVEFFAPW
jgi:protein disulfide-isomerase A1